jgi:hypothetical protein
MEQVEPARTAALGHILSQSVQQTLKIGPLKAFSSSAAARNAKLARNSFS